MGKKALTLFLLVAFLAAILAQSQNFFLVQANPHYMPPIDPGIYYIDSNGMVKPSTAPIQQVGNVYTLTSDIIGHPIWIQYSGAVLEGAGHLIKGNQTSGFGVTLNCTKNVIVKNLQVTGFLYGIFVHRQEYGVPFNWDKPVLPDNPYPKSSKNAIINCSLVDNKIGIKIQYSSSNQLTKNMVSGSDIGIEVQGEENKITNCQIKLNSVGIHIESSSETAITTSEIKQNSICGVNIAWSSNNNVFNNSVTNNQLGIIVTGSPGPGSTATANIISGNLIAKNIQWGIRLNGSQTENQIYGNNFIDNNLEQRFQVSIPAYMDSGVANGATYVNYLPGLGNYWNSSSIGNFWSDYQTRYPNATEINQTGLGNTPFSINENNIDCRPSINLLENTPSLEKEEQAQPTSNAVSFQLILLLIALGIIFACLIAFIWRRKKNAIEII